jgi:hypothetical protein
VEALNAAVLGRGIGSSSLVDNPMGRTPVRDQFGDEFAIVSDDDFELMSRLILYGAVPISQGISCRGFKFKGRAPHVASVIVDEIHDI